VVRRQFLLRLAYATTFNSSQGLTLDRTVVDLQQGVFAHGQLYTALNRIRQRGDGRVLFGATNVAGLTNNVVSQELLL
jgi:ATP-dependent exoDNAse (exonuclease V) alpha subunit